MVFNERFFSPKSSSVCLARNRGAHGRGRTTEVPGEESQLGTRGFVVFFGFGPKNVVKDYSCKQWFKRFVCLFVEVVVGFYRMFLQACGWGSMFLILSCQMHKHTLRTTIRVYEHPRSYATYHSEGVAGSS